MPARRRDVLAKGVAGLAAAGLAAAGIPGQPAAQPALPDPYAPQRLEFVMEIIADIAPAEDIGPGPLGGRRIVPIMGGTFSGPRLKGTVRTGGADRQLIRPDGVRQLTAQYELQTEDNFVIGVLNKVLVEDLPGGGRYAFSHVELTAPKGAYDWLNHGRFVGTLQPLRPARNAVRVRLFRMF